MVSRKDLALLYAVNTGRPGLSGRAIRVLASGIALGAGVLAPSVALGQCKGTPVQFNGASGMNALTSAIGTVNMAFLSSGSAFVSEPDSAPNQQGGGVWIRTVGGTVEAKGNANFKASINVTAPAGYPAPPINQIPISLSCNTKVSQDFAGFQAGQDIAFLNESTFGANWHIGVLAGHVGANVKNVSPEDMLKGSFEAPFAGLYAAFSKGDFFADVQARLSFLQIEAYGQRLDSRSHSFTANMGYHFDLGRNWSLEPSVGGVLSQTSVDRLDLMGAITNLRTPFGNLAIPAAGSLQIDDVPSALGRASMKLGTSVTLDGGQITASPFVSASVFREFAGNVGASGVATGTLSPYPYAVSATGNITASRLGTYAQFGLGSTFQLAHSGWLGYARVDYLTGDNIQGISLNAGLRYEINPGTASLKDGVRAKYSATEGYSWTGFYVGASGGGAWGGMRWADRGNPANPDFAGYLASGQAGYNYQLESFVLGAEADGGLSNARGGKSCPASIYVGCESDVGALGSLTARLGYPSGRALFYVKGGLAFAEITAGESDPYAKTAVASTTQWETGWTAGGGMELGLAENWSAKAEYMHFEFPKEAFVVRQGVTQSATTGGDTVVVGFNYRLGR